MPYPPYFWPMPIKVDRPVHGVRVISRTIWHDVIYKQWIDYKEGRVLFPPQLAPPSSRGLFFTDAESLQVCRNPQEFGMRLGLLEHSQLHTDGCAIIYFDTEGLEIEQPRPFASPGIPLPQPGLTVGGAREWIARGNIDLNLDDYAMEVFIIEPSDARWGPVSPRP